MSIYYAIVWDAGDGPRLTINTDGQTEIYTTRANADGAAARKNLASHYDRFYVLPAEVFITREITTTERTQV
jgi:hypothetical protein